MTTLKVEIVTPEKALWSGEARALMARSSVGEFTVLAQHAETVGDLVSGIVRVETGEGEIAFAVHGGYFQVGPGASDSETLATVLASGAEKSTDIDTARAEAAKERAEAALAAAAAAGSEDHLAGLSASAALQRAELRIRAAAK